MARNSWEADVDVESFGGGGGGGRRFVRVLVGLGFVASLTFVFAYYMPLLRTHQALVERHRVESERAHATEASLARVQSELKATTERQAQLDKERETRENAEARGKAGLDSLSSDLGSKLGKYVSKGVISVSRGKDGVVLAVSRDALLAKGKDELSPKAKAVLCDVAKATAAGSFRVIAAPDAAASADSAWKAPAARAAAVAEGLVSQCSVAAERVSVVVGGKTGASAISSERIGVELVPSSATP